MTIPLPLYPVRHHEPCCRPARLPNLHQADDPGACPPESGGTSGDSDLQVRTLRRSLLKNQRRQVNLRHSPPSSPGTICGQLSGATGFKPLPGSVSLFFPVLQGLRTQRRAWGHVLPGATVRPLPNIPTNNLAAVAAGQKSRLHIGHISSRPTHRDRPGRQDRPGRRISLTISSRGLAATAIVRHRTSGYAKTPDSASGAFDVRAIRKQLTSNGELSLRAH
jgi:hypothetical protein